MKRITFVIALFFHSSVYSQTERSLCGDYKNRLLINFGVVNHLNKTQSENGRILAKPTTDVSPSIEFFHYFKNNSAISFGYNFIGFTNKFKTNSGQNGTDFDGDYKSFSSSSFYSRIDLNYYYFIRLVPNIYLGGYLGPSLQIQHKSGLYDNYNWIFTETSNNVVLYTIEVGFESYKIKQVTPSAQIGLLLNLKLFKKDLLSVQFGYDAGFKNYNSTYVTLKLDGNLIDKGSILSNGTGITSSLGICFPLSF